MSDPPQQPGTYGPGYGLKEMVTEGLTHDIINASCELMIFPLQSPLVVDTAAAHSFLLP